MSTCFSAEVEDCKDEETAKKLKIIAIAAILIASSLGVGIPILGKKRKFLRPNGPWLSGVKSFAAGVILATGFVHMLPSGSDALSNPCLSMSKFPFSGLFAMIAALLTLLFDLLATHYYGANRSVNEKRTSSTETEPEGLHAVSCYVETGSRVSEGHSIVVDDHNGHVRGFNNPDGNHSLRQVVVSQILELGIVSHSIIIGLSLGVSGSPCTIRPLIPALSFHQFFEGFALGGCISQAQFKTTSALIMAVFFAITTPAGIGVGMGIASVYNSNSEAALITEGILDSMSAGILIYMALVELIAEEFVKTNVTLRQQFSLFLLLLLGSGMMAMLAIWA